MKYLPVEVLHFSMAMAFTYAGSQRVAMMAGSTVYYLLTDHLGSTALTVTSAGAIYGEKRYKPWGEERYTSGTTPTTFRFTGQRIEAGLGGASGLYFYGARWLDPALGRFLSPDTLVPDPYNPFDWDLYSYTRNNPVNYNDPTGHMVDDGCQTEGCGLPAAISNPSNNDQGINNDPSSSGCYNSLCLPDTPSPITCSVCLSSWEKPSWWDTNPLHPDYFILAGSGSIFTVVIILDRFGGIYVGGGVNIGRSLGSPTVSINGGYIGSAIDSTYPDQANTVSFLTEFTFSGSIGAVGDVTITWSPGAGNYVDHISWEFGGLLPASLGVSATYSFKIYDIGDLYGR